MTKEQYLAGVDQTKEHIQAGDVFQLVLSQRFQRHTLADPFEIYRYTPMAALTGTPLTDTPDWHTSDWRPCLAQPYLAPLTGTPD